VISGAVLFIKEDLAIKEVQEEVLVGSLNIVSLVGALAAGRIADAVGRKWTMAVAALFFLLGAVVMGLAPNFPVLMVGRVLAGIGVGFALMIAPVYTAELAPASSRGSLVSLPEIFINFGILLGYIVSFCLSGLPPYLSWRLMLGAGSVPAIFLALSVLLMPESPRWLVTQNRIQEAEHVLLKTSYDKAEASARLVEIMGAAGFVRSTGLDGAQSEPGWNDASGNNFIMHAGSRSQGEGVWRELLWPTPPVRRMLIVALGINFFQQASGIDATVYYSPAVFSQAGISGKSGVLGATVAVGFSKTLFILVATIWLDRIGRRPLLFTSAIGMTVSLFTLAIGFVFLHVPKPSSDDLPVTAGVQQNPGFVAILAVLAICAYVAFFSIGFGPINWVLTSEIFPLQLRAQAMGLGIVMNRLASGTVALTFLSLADAITIAGVFFLFSLIAALSILFIYFYCPETKGKTLEEIAKFFERDSDHRISPSVLEMGSLHLDDQNGTVLPRLHDNPKHDPELEEEDLHLIGHDGLSIVDEAVARKQLLSKVRLIAKQRLNEQ
jgi:MFS family permease